MAELALYIGCNMSVFNKVLEAMQNRPVNGHAAINIQNRFALANAKKEIEELMGVSG